MKEQTDSELASLGLYLWEKKDTILERWLKEAEKSKKRYFALAALSREEFYNSIPDFITHLKKRLCHEKDKIEKISREHGAQRWKFNFNLREIIKEWELLHSILMDEISRAPDSMSIQHESINQAQQMIAGAIHKGIQESVDEFYSSRRAEAQERIGELEKNLKEYTEQSELQGHNLRQASHDLGGSVALIQMHLHLLKKEDMTPEAVELVEKLTDSSDNLVKLFKSLLDLFRLEAGDEEVEVSTFDAADLLDKLCHNMQSLAEEKNLKLYAKGEKPLSVRGDWIKIRRIAQNLIMNSLKYTQEGYVEINWNSGPGKYWMLSIRDTGPGLDTANLKSYNSSDENSHFSSGNRDQESDQNQTLYMQNEGIGLSIVRRLCELLKAVVHVESEPGKGTLFRIVFPSDYPKLQPKRETVSER